MSYELAFGILLAILLLNLLVMLLYRHDKRSAKQGGWRVSETTLMVAALFAPFGAVYGMRRYHHKTRHLKFLLVYVFMLVQLTAFAYAFWIVVF